MAVITVHILNDIPWSNLNRDDTGTPKRAFIGGVERGMLSSQSLKRAARKDYERRSLKQGRFFDSYRSRSEQLTDFIIDRAETLANEQLIDKKTAKADINKLIQGLTGKGDNKTLIWLSFEELEALAQRVASQNIPVNASDVVVHGKTGSLAIAAFGRMFANATSLQTESTVAVSPAISTHAVNIETDYFITADDLVGYGQDGEQAGAGAGMLGIQLYTNGIFYRSFTIDSSELCETWTGIDNPHAREQLEQFVRSMIYILPTGKKNQTAPYVEPLIVLAEEQNYREAYDFHEAVKVADGGYGYISGSIAILAKQFHVAREVSPENYGRSLLSGTHASEFEGFDDVSSNDKLISGVVDWILEAKSSAMPKIVFNPETEGVSETTEDSETFSD